MKLKFLSLFAILVLLGAGCAAPTQDNTTEPETSDAVTTEESISNENEDSENTESTDEEHTEAETEQALPPATEEQQAQQNQGQVIVEEDESGNGAEVIFDDVQDITLGGDIDQRINMESTNFAFTPDVITAGPNERVEITFTKNVGFHNFMIDEIDLNYTIKEGNKLIFRTPNEAGSYAFYCGIGSHRANGMEGTLIVQ